MHTAVDAKIGRGSSQGGAGAIRMRIDVGYRMAGEVVGNEYRLTRSGTTTKLIDLPDDDSIVKGFV